MLSVHTWCEVHANAGDGCCTAGGFYVFIIGRSWFGSWRLVVGGSLVVRRDAPDGQLLMEGPLCEDYFTVRDVVYSQYNVC
jgi:hypothetical protein